MQSKAVLEKICGWCTLILSIIAFYFVKLLYIVTFILHCSGSGVRGRAVESEYAITDQSLSPLTSSQQPAGDSEY